VADPGAPNGSGYERVVTGAPGQWSTVARTTFPDEPFPGATFTDLFFSEPRINDAAQVLFRGEFAGPAVPPGTGDAYFRWSAGATEVVARIGIQAPSLPPGVIFAGFGPSPGTVSNSGRAEFIAGLNGPGIDSSNAVAIWAGGPDDLHPFLRAGDTTPGLEPGVTVHGLDQATMNNTDHVAADGSLSGASITPANDQALWLGPVDGSPQVVMREGTAAPGLPGLAFGFNPDHTLGLPSPVFALNDEQDLLLLAGITGPGVTTRNNIALWFRDAQTSDWSLILRKGDTVGGHAIAYIEILAGSSAGGKSQGLLDDGTFVSTLAFTDGSFGVYRFSVPEPSSLVYLTSAVAALLGSRRRREAR
jgi:hypothetical protein